MRCVRFAELTKCARLCSVAVPRRSRIRKTVLRVKPAQSQRPLRRCSHFSSMTTSCSKCWLALWRTVFTNVGSSVADGATPAGSCRSGFKHDSVWTHPAWRKRRRRNFQTLRRCVSKTSWGFPEELRWMPIRFPTCRNSRNCTLCRCPSSETKEPQRDCVQFCYH